MGFTVIIPSRYASIRLPGKPLSDIAGQAMIAHVVARAQQSNAHRVIVATDDQRIADYLRNYDCEVCITRVDHQSGSDRLAEVIENLGIPEDEIIVNVQGDEPMIPPQLINQVAERLAQSPAADMSTAAQEITSHKDFENPNVVKVVMDQRGRALYFSRSPIPYRGESGKLNAWHHIGIYAYRAKFLANFAGLEPSLLEQSESLEQLRVLDNGGQIVVQKVDYPAGIGVDTVEDLEKVRLLLEETSA